MNQEKLDIILLQETKQGERDMGNIINKMNNYMGTVVESRGASGGIATIWNQNAWKQIAIIKTQNWIKVYLQNTQENMVVTVYNIYGPNNYKDKEVCWSTMKADIDSEENKNIIIKGDLKQILHANEKRGGKFNFDPSRDQLETIIQTHDLIDIIPKK